MKMLSSIRKKQLDIESSKIEEIKKLQNAVVHSNTLQQSWDLVVHFEPIS